MGYSIEKREAVTLTHKEIALLALCIREMLHAASKGQLPESFRDFFTDEPRRWIKHASDELWAVMVKLPQEPD